MAERFLTRFIGNLHLVGHEPLAHHPLCCEPPTGTGGFWGAWLRFAGRARNFSQPHFSEHAPDPFGIDGLRVRASFLVLGESFDDDSDICGQKLYFCIVGTPHINGGDGVNGVHGGRDGILTERLNHERHEVVLFEVSPLLLIRLGERFHPAGEVLHPVICQPVGHS